jgi:hypothetical protein
MADLLPIALVELIACVEREVRMRERVYPRQVANGQMTQEKANREIALMQQVAMFLRDHDPDR